MQLFATNKLKELHPFLCDIFARLVSLCAFISPPLFLVVLSVHLYSFILIYLNLFLRIDDCVYSHQRACDMIGLVS